MKSIARGYYLVCRYVKELLALLVMLLMIQTMVTMIWTTTMITTYCESSS